MASTKVVQGRLHEANIHSMGSCYYGPTIPLSRHVLQSECYEDKQEQGCRELITAECDSDQGLGRCLQSKVAPADA